MTLPFFDYSILLHVAEVDLLVDATGPDEGSVQGLRVVGSHDDDSVRRVDDTVEYVQEALTYKK